MHRHSQYMRHIERMSCRLVLFLLSVFESKIVLWQTSLEYWVSWGFLFSGHSLGHIITHTHTILCSNPVSCHQYVSHSFISILISIWTKQSVHMDVRHYRLFLIKYGKQSSNDFSWTTHHRFFFRRYYLFINSFYTLEFTHSCLHAYNGRSHCRQQENKTRGKKICKLFRFVFFFLLKLSNDVYWWWELNSSSSIHNS